MKLNHDCVRELLLYIEENQEFDAETSSSVRLPVKTIVDSLILSKYSKSEIIYSIVMTEEYGLIRTVSADVVGPIMIKCMTASGHDYLSSIRNPKIWASLKDQLLGKGIDLTFSSIASAIPGILSKFLT